MTYPTALLRGIACGVYPERSEWITHFGVQNFIEQLAGPRRHEGTKFHKESASCLCSFVAQKNISRKGAKNGERHDDKNYKALNGATQEKFNSSHAAGFIKNKVYIPNDIS